MKKALKMFLSLALVSTMLLTACGKQGGETNSSDKDSGNDKTTDQSKADGEDGSKKDDDGGKEADGNLNLEGLPLVKEQESFSLFVDNSGLAEEKVYYPILEEQTNVKVDLTVYPYETATEKLNILINGGDYPDVIGGWIVSANDVVKNGMKEGLYIPLEEYFNEKSTPNIMEVLAQPKVEQTMTLPDGHIYSIPYIIGTPIANFLPYINTKWLDKVGMDMPKTPEELKEVLIAFRDKDPNGNGKKDEIPFTSEPNNMNLEAYAGWWGQTMDGTHFAMVDGELTYQGTSEEFKTVIKYFADLYKEGLVDPEMFTQDNATWKAKGAQDLYGVSIAYGSGDFYEGDKARENIDEPGDFTWLPVLKAEGVEKAEFIRGSYGNTIYKNQVVVTDKAKNPLLITRWFDNVFETENSVQIQWGLIGKKIEKVDDKNYRSIADDKISEEDKTKYDWANMFTQSLPKYIPADVNLLPPEGEKIPYDQKVETDKAYEPFLNEMIPSVWFSEEQSSRASIIQTDLDEYRKNKIAQWVSGQADIDAEWDEYVKKLDELGLQEFIEMRTELVKAAMENQE